MLPPVVVPWIRAGHEGASDYELHTLIVRPSGEIRWIKDLFPRADAPGGRWIAISTNTQRPLTMNRLGSVRPARLTGPFMTESDYGGELAVSPDLRLTALAGRGRLLLQRWQNGAGGRLVGSLALPTGENLEPDGAAWNANGQLAIGSHDTRTSRYGRGWLYAYRSGRMRLVARPRFGGAVIGWVGDRVLVHQKLPFTEDEAARPRLTSATGRTISIGPRAIAVGTDGRLIVLVTSRSGSGRRESLSWRDTDWRQLSRSVLLPTRKGAEYDDFTFGSPLLLLTSGRQAR